MDAQIRKNLRPNIIFNLLDGGFFGLALGFASFTTVIPLFVKTLTDSAILIGLVPAIHSVGWQLPQLLTADQVSRQKRYKPMVLFMTIQERLPFLGLALIAWSLPRLSVQAALVLTFILLIWQGMGGGLTATAWQSMIGKIIPGDRRGRFFGFQSAVANGAAFVSAIGAGWILQQYDSPLDYGLCFLLASAFMGISYFFLAQNREPEHEPKNVATSSRHFWRSLGAILRRDRSFCWFLVMRMVSMAAIMGSAFYSVYVVSYHGVSELEVGIMTGVMLVAQVLAGPTLGWIGDRWSYHLAMMIGAVAAILGGLAAWSAPSAGWFYPVFILTGIANAAIWTIAVAMIMEFGVEAERSAYIGMGNSLVAPLAILAPLFGGWLAEAFGYSAAFLGSAIAGGVMLAVLLVMVQDSRKNVAAAPAVLQELGAPAPALADSEEKFDI